MLGSISGTPRSAWWKWNFCCNLWLAFRLAFLSFCGNAFVVFVVVKRFSDKGKRACASINRRRTWYVPSGDMDATAMAQVTMKKSRGRTKNRKNHRENARKLPEKSAKSCFTCCQPCLKNPAFNGQTMVEIFEFQAGTGGVAHIKTKFTITAKRSRARLGWLAWPCHGKGLV